MVSERVLWDPNAQEQHGHEKLLAPANEWFATALWRMLQSILQDRSMFELAFDRLVYVVALYWARISAGSPVGEFGYAEAGERPFTGGSLGNQPSKGSFYSMPISCTFFALLYS